LQIQKPSEVEEVLARPRVDYLTFGGPAYDAPVVLDVQIDPDVLRAHHLSVEGGRQHEAGHGGDGAGQREGELVLREEAQAPSVRDWVNLDDYSSSSNLFWRCGRNSDWQNP